MRTKPANREQHGKRGSILLPIQIILNLSEVAIIPGYTA